jgi:V/A-type H+-transporting ATPase subunit F
MKIAGLLDKDTAIGFKLAGIRDIYISNKDNSKKWDEIIDRDDIGIILITEKIANEIKTKLNDFRLRNTIPIILEIPDKNGRLIDHIDYISSLIKKAVGVEIIKDK